MPGFIAAISVLFRNRMVITVATLVLDDTHTSSEPGTKNHSPLGNQAKALKVYIKMFQKAADGA